MTFEVGSIVTVGLALITALVAIYSRLSSLDAKVKWIVERSQEDRAEHNRLWARLDGHERRVTILETRCPVQCERQEGS